MFDRFGCPEIEERTIVDRTTSRDRQIIGQILSVQRVKVEGTKVSRRRDREVSLNQRLGDSVIQFPDAGDRDMWLLNCGVQLILFRYGGSVWSGRWVSIINFGKRESGGAARITQSDDNAITMTTGNATKKGQPETTTCWRSREVYRVSLGRERGMGKKGAIGV